MNMKGFTPLDESTGMGSTLKHIVEKIHPASAGKSGETCTSLTGFTLLEVMIAASIMVVVLGIALSFSITATQQAKFNTDDAYTVRGTVKIFEYLKKDISQGTADYNNGLDTDLNAITGTIQPAANNTPVNTLTLRKLAGFDAATTKIIHSKPIVYALQLAPWEGTAFDGADNDGNGLADEMVLTRTFDPGGTEQLFERVSTDILFADNTGFTVTRINNLIVIDLVYLAGDATRAHSSTSFALLPPLSP
jgi:prepilin-type N-terminal cleavage/methylation domain-containing protein